MSKVSIKRGRPAQLSREQILGCALELLKNGSEQVTIHGVAKAMGCAPMSLYSHIKNRDDMLLGLAELALGNLDITLPENGSWQANVRGWLYQVHEHLAACPQVLSLINGVARLNGNHGNLLTPWLRIHAVLLCNLERAGFEGEQLLQLSRWLAQLVISDVMLNPPKQIDDRVDAFKSAREGMSISDKETFLRITPFIGQTRTRLFDFVVGQALMHLEHLSSQLNPNLIQSGQGYFTHQI